MTAACEAKDAKLPDDMASIADAEGIRASVLSKYLSYVSNPVLAALFAAFPAVRDRALADPTFLFKLGVEVFGDVGLSVAAEMHSRNDHFADEAEFFVADVVAGSALNAAVLTMLSPTVSFGVSPGGGRALRMLSRVDGKLNDFIRLLFCRALPPAFPASAFVPGAYPAWRRVGSLALQGVRVGGVSALVGFAGQAAANGVCRLRRKYAPGGYSEGYAGTIHPEEPPLLEPAAEWGAFMGLSGNLRQQAIIGAELAMRESARVHPAVAAAATVAMRLLNNVWGGEKFAERMRAMENEVYGVEA